MGLTCFCCALCTANLSSKAAEATPLLRAPSTPLAPLKMPKLRRKLKATPSSCPCDSKARETQLAGAMHLAKTLTALVANYGKHICGSQKGAPAQQSKPTCCLDRMHGMSSSSNYV